MDITNLFKASIKTVRTRNKAFGVEITDKNRILRPRNGQQNSGFTLKAREIVSNITRLRDFLVEHRKGYLNFAGHLSDEPRLSDSERDKIDAGAQRIINTCSHLIQDFRREMAKQGDASSQLSEHRQNVIFLLEAYLKAVCKTYSEQRAIRVKRTVDLQKLSRLEGSPKKIPRRSLAEFGDGESSAGSRLLNSAAGEEEMEGTEAVTDDVSGQLSAEELQMFEQENEQLFNELNSLGEEVVALESRVVEVSELQAVFTEKVLQQDKDIDRIQVAAVGATENVKEANQQIREAIQRNAGLRVYVLFFLLVMSFSLLFLDWYND